MTYKAINILFALVGVTALVLFSSGFISFWWLFMVPVLYVIIMLVISTNVQFNFFVKSFNKNPHFDIRAVALSFDDGPAESTLEILEILDRYQAKAAFFCIGRNIEKNPEIFREIVKRGHIVGNHTFTHTRKMGFLKSDRIVREIRRCDKIAEEVGGVKMKLFRPPFGIINPETKRALQQTGHQVMGWNIRPYDAITRSPEVILNRITRKLKKGDLILLHDNMDKTAIILEQLLVILKRRKFEIVRPDKLFEINAYN